MCKSYPRQALDLKSSLNFVATNIWLSIWPILLDTIGTSEDTNVNDNRNRTALTWRMCVINNWWSCLFCSWGLQSGSCSRCSSSSGGGGGSILCLVSLDLIDEKLTKCGRKAMYWRNIRCCQRKGVASSEMWWPRVVGFAALFFQPRNNDWLVLHHCTKDGIFLLQLPVPERGMRRHGSSGKRQFPFFFFSLYTGLIFVEEQGDGGYELSVR